MRLAVGLLMGGAAFANDTNNFVDPYLILAFSTISLTIIRSITGISAWSLQRHVNVSYSKTISKKKISVIEKYTLVTSE
ncbi:MAG TPA: hypothetical protein VFM99_06670 [Chitinophagales bacterium]|nr:hypothetical protein [Chitinophagales bacterium]